MGRGVRKYRYTLEDVQRVTGLTESQFRREREAGRLDPGDLESIIRFVESRRLAVALSAVKAIADELMPSA